ncbi:MAG: phosphomannomutase/phosphoglucomutase [Nitrospirae bacterium]|nr:phosphomannomutase/phosphoglucomutase [Nitrospirota bacterium]
MKIKDEIFRQYDIRGVVGKDLDRDVAFRIGRAFSVFLKGTKPGAKRLSVGRDVRLSSDELAEGVIRGMVSAGFEVVDIGVCPTPLQYFSLHHLDLDGGIMVTGSHNPPEYNGFKLSAGKETLHGSAIQAIREEIMSDRGEGEGEKKAAVAHYDIIEAYNAYMLRQFSPLADRKYRRLSVVVDAGNGTAGPIVPGLLGALGCEVISLYCEPDGRFPNHHPDPTVVEYMQDLITTTRESGADFGVAYDGDADRIGVVSREGAIVWGDQLMIVLSRDILGRNPGAGIIGDVKCSQAMFDDVRAHGGAPIMWKTGHSLIKQKMRDEKALLAGEFSGHIFIAERYFGYDDAIYTTLRLVEIMKKSGRDIAALLSDVPRMFHTPEMRVDCAEEMKGEVVERVVRKFLEYRDNGTGGHVIRDIDTTDGIRVVFEKGWGLVRVSNTQPVIVMRFEASDEESLGSYREFMEREVQSCHLRGGRKR